MGRQTLHHNNKEMKPHEIICPFFSEKLGKIAREAGSCSRSHLWWIWYNWLHLQETNANDKRCIGTMFNNNFNERVFSLLIYWCVRPKGNSASLWHVSARSYFSFLMLNVAELFRFWSFLHQKVESKTI